ncbi:beta-lactamase domain protein [Methanococcus vannielii SB]|jgi:flavorubredoxin|uniref:Beta-lactamase domain protein n=1 Tax=Methanococcus vannielii (strain ATCC 35089 / DSM 1224 / JCM 13029 / OCM 148 / SB) TaxID=406327 RepID=A6UPG7_METVS|nr:FprA family A-type flavoprotein [Methanococcus vannielii]ABR54389.1 beta-lactamase domain protein [Methanococcus vannielii SB]
MPEKLKENIYWVGAIDWNIRDFHGYETKNGSTYNSYLITDEKVVLIDTVKHYLFDEFLDRIKKIIDPKKIDYIVVNHVEMDHSSSLEKIIKISNAKIITNEKAKEHLNLHYDTTNWEFIIVDSNDSLNIGKKNLKFIKTPMLHWPDNMVTYAIEDKILFSNDAFGQHIASFERYDFEVDGCIESAKEYFANILLPYKSLIPNAIKTVDSLNIDLVCPSHGVIWKKDVQKIKECYLKWASNEVLEKAVIVYDSMYGSTEKIGCSIAEGLVEGGISVKIFKLSRSDISAIMNEIIDAKYVLIGSPTLNINIYPEVAKFLKYMEGLKPSKKIAVAFGSYGWAESATLHIKNIFNNISFENVDDECLTVRFVPKEEDLKKCYEFGKKLSKM